MQIQICTKKRKKGQSKDRWADRYADVAGRKKNWGSMTYALYTMSTESGIGTIL